MSAYPLHEAYAALRKEAERMASAFAALVPVIEKDPDIAANLCHIFEVYACGVLDEHPIQHKGGEA